MSVPHPAHESGLTFETTAPMFAASEGLKIVRWNEAAEELLGVTRAEALGRPCYEVLGCPEAARRSCGRCFELRIPTPAGDAIWVNVTILLAASGADPPVRVHLLRELTPQKRLEELLRQVVSTASELYVTSDGRAARERPDRAPLLVTAREREVIALLAQGRSTKGIAARLGITPRTARNHIQNILCKLRVHSRVEVVAYASARGLV